MRTAAETMLPPMLTDPATDSTVIPTTSIFRLNLRVYKRCCSTINAPAPTSLLVPVIVGSGNSTGDDQEG
jgi:hypothetical protein